MACALGLALTACVGISLPAAALQAGPEPGRARGDTSSFWLSEGASADSLDVFWSGLQQEWLDELSEDVTRFELAESQLDSLLAIGEVKLMSTTYEGI